MSATDIDAHTREEHATAAANAHRHLHEWILADAANDAATARAAVIAAHTALHHVGVASRAPVPSPLPALLRDLRDVGTGAVAHGAESHGYSCEQCPVGVHPKSSRDLDCPACRVLLRSDEALDGRILDAGQRTDAEIADALRGHIRDYEALCAQLTAERKKAEAGKRVWKSIAESAAEDVARADQERGHARTDLEGERDVHARTIAALTAARSDLATATETIREFDAIDDALRGALADAADVPTDPIAGVAELVRQRDKLRAAAGALSADAGKARAASDAAEAAHRTQRDETERLTGLLDAAWNERDALRAEVATLRLLVVAARVEMRERAAEVADAYAAQSAATPEPSGDYHHEIRAAEAIAITIRALDPAPAAKP